MKKGFTLLELMIVVIILGVLATLAMTQYPRFTERARTVEAKTILSAIATEIFTLDAEGRTVNNTNVGIGTTATQYPSSARDSHYYSYNISATTNPYSVVATRCGTTINCKQPPPPSNYSITLTINVTTGERTLISPY